MRNEILNNLKVNAVYLDDSMNDKLKFSNDLELEIKEARLCLKSILNTSNAEMQEMLLDTFLRYLIKNKNYKQITKTQNLKNNNTDFKQFDKIADLIEPELERLKLPKEIGNFGVLNVIRDKCESIGVEANSKEELEFIDYLIDKWDDYQGKI
jgi:hypothetical protein